MMRKYDLKMMLLLLFTVAAAVGCVNDVPETVVVPEGGLIEVTNGIPDMASAGVMAFTDDNALLVADYEAGTIFAFEVDRGRSPLLLVPYNVTNIDLQIATLLGTSVDQITINDMIVHPVNSTAYLSVMIDEGDAAVPALFNVDSDGYIEWVDLSTLSYTSIAIEGLPENGSQLSVTDIDYYDGALFVSGLSNGELASEIRRVTYPFDGTVTYTNTEIYRPSDNQVETDAPIRSQAIVESEEGPLLVAAYSGTPLVTFPLSDLQDGALVRGKTVAELGYGSIPIDLLHYSEFGTDKFLITSTGYNIKTFETEQVLTAHAGTGLSDPIAPGVIEGVEPTNSALSAVSQISDLDAVHLLMLRTNRETGNLDLVSTVKSVFFRLSDFQSEYDSAGYNYPDDGSQRATKIFHNIFRLNEGHRDEVVLP